MSDFLRDLSPHRAHEASRAVPVLPSPFEATHPLRAVRVDATPLDPAEDPIASVRPSAPPQHDSPAPPPAVKRSRAMPLEAAAIVQQPISTSPNDPPARPSPRVDAPLPPLISPIVTRPPRHVSPALAPDRTAREATLASPAIASPSISADTARPFRGRTRPASTTSTPLAIDAPMSSRALAARITPHAEQAPIINVTIDRIDVRAPAAPERAKPSARSRPSTPTQSLSDYLRGREPERRGGLR